MTLLIDPPNAAGHGRWWSHLASDSSYDELHAFAASLGIPPRGFDRDHYDVPASHYESVLEAGASPVTSRELVVRLTVAGLRRRKHETLGPRRAGSPLVRAHTLVAGDRVSVVAPAGPVAPDRLDAGLAVLASWGLHGDLTPHVRGPAAGLGYLAATDEQRAGDLMAAWADSDVSAVFCARGGYGAQRIVDLLDWGLLARRAPKALVGFSDVTGLHQAFATRLGMSTVHGPTVTNLGEVDATSVEHLRRLLLEPGDFPTLTPEPVEGWVPGRAEGVLVGGNVALLAASAGTPDAGGAREGIAVLEDVGEEPFRLDRMLTQLLRSGWFDGVRGVALGEFRDCGPLAAVRELVADRLRGLGVPMLWGVPVGHGERNLAFPLGVRARIDADAGTLTLSEAPLRG